MNQIPKLFSKKVIFLFSVFVSLLFGGLLFADNLNQTGRNKYILPIISGCVIFNVLLVLVFKYIFNSPSTLLIAVQIGNIIGAYVLVVPIWNNLLGDIEEYEKKSVLGPITMFLLIAAIIFLFAFFKLSK